MWNGLKQSFQFPLLVRIIIVTAFLLPQEAMSQNDTSIYRVMKIVEANDYKFSVPEQWKNVPQIENSPLKQKFEFTTVGIPIKVNDAPLTAFLILRKLEADSVQQGEQFIIKEFTDYPDRINQAGETYETEPLTIASGETATLIHTRFYRRSKVSNFTRYDLIAYSAKRKTAYMMTITYQYKDATYRIEADHKLRQYAVRILKSLYLR